MKLSEAILRLQGCHNIPMLFQVSSELVEIYDGNLVVIEYLKEMACEILEGFEDSMLTEEALEQGRKRLFSRQVFTHGPLPEA